MGNHTYTTSSVTSRDGTTIGYRQLGNGPGIILLHGGASASQSYMKLGTLLSDAFTIYIPDRRGHGFFRDLVVQKMLEATKQADGSHFEIFRRINVSARK